MRARLVELRAGSDAREAGARRAPRDRAPQRPVDGRGDDADGHVRRAVGVPARRRDARRRDRGQRRAPAGRARLPRRALLLVVVVVVRRRQADAGQLSLASLRGRLIEYQLRLG